MDRLAGHSALITGGSSGIGLATAQLFLEEGAAVTISGRNQDRLDSALKTLAPLGAAHAVQGDVSRLSDASRMVEEAIEHHGHLDVLFCNAGTPSAGGGILNLTEDEWDRVLGTNLKGIFTVVKAAVPHMKERGWGAIVTMGSEAGIAGNGEIPAYCASKGGIVLLTKALALDLIPYGIRVNCICPGITSTPQIEEEIGISADPDALRKEFETWAPIARWADPREQAHGVLYLVADATFAVGSVLSLDGGFTAR